MKKKNWIRILAGIGIYLGLLIVLLLSEASYRGGASGQGTEAAAGVISEDASEITSEAAPEIDSLGDAAWYSLITLTTVGYGDLVPKSWMGKVIGAIYAVLSTFLVAFLIGFFLSLLRGRLLPVIRMYTNRGKRWYIFEEYNAITSVLGKNLLKEESGSAIIFSGNPADRRDEGADGIIYTDLCAEELLRRFSDRSKCTVFCMGEDGFANYQRGLALMQNGVDVCCLTEYEPDRYPVSLNLYDPYISCARTYWKQYPVRMTGETIVLIGSGKYAEALLEQALTVNVFDPAQKFSYLVYGDFTEFRANHPYLSQICRMDCTDPCRAAKTESISETAKTRTHSSSRSITPAGDRLLIDSDHSTRDILAFNNTLWNEDRESIQNADRIILCFEKESDNLAAFNKIHRYIPVSAPIYAKLPCGFDKVIPYCAPEAQFTSENVLRKELDRQGRLLHEIYLNSEKKTSPRWEDAGAFIRRSNIASADHLAAKIRVLLGDEAGKTPTKEIYDAAILKWKKLWPEKKDLFRWIEHERWVRFYHMNNWEYSETRDDEKWKHNLLRPMACLSEKDQVKGDYSWAMLGEIAKSL